MRQKQYLKGITSIRFFLAVLVVINHCSKNLKGYEITWGKGFSVLQKGDLAVEYFFVLSGFLLTYLAYSEYQKLNRIRIKSFFIRRILRIFPLYYLAVFLGYFVLGVLFPIVNGFDYAEFNLAEGLPFHLLLLPNWSISLPLNNMGSLYFLWSIGVEEQFYLFFPFLCTFLFKKKRFILYFGIITTCYLIAFNLFQEYFPSSLPVIIKHFASTLKFHFMLIGGFFALLFSSYRSIFQEIFSSKIIRIITLLLFILTVCTSLSIFNYELIYGSIFCLFLISITYESNSRKFFENKYLKYLGSISFGIYIYHPFVLYLLRYLMEFNSDFLEVITAIPILYYLIEIFITVVVSHFSYQFYEVRFLRMKTKYAL